MAHTVEGLRAPVTSSLTTPFAGLFATLRRRHIERQTFNALMALSDRELDDLGLTRGDLAETARRSAADY